MIWLLIKWSFFIGLPLFVGGWIYRRLGGTCRSNNRLDGKTVIITGGTAGIGKETARDLALRGARVIVACRNKQKGAETKAWIQSFRAGVEVVIKSLDVSDLGSVTAFASDVIKTEKRLDILINNAGIGLPDRRESAQGFEMVYATNHLGHFLLTNLLLDKMKKTGKGRIINVSSLAHKSFHLDFDDLHFKSRSYGPWVSYCQSKLCNILFTNELARRLKGTGITVNSLHPGAVATEIMNKENTILGTILSFISKITLKTSLQGAQTTIYLAVADEVENITGEYFVDCKIASTSKESKNTSFQKRLWDISEEESKLKE